MDETADKKVLGWVLAANPICQMISSPFFGWLGNRWNSVRWLCVITGLLNVLGFSLYASVGALPEPRRYWMIAARFIVGIAAGWNKQNSFFLLHICVVIVLYCVAQVL